MLICWRLLLLWGLCLAGGYRTGRGHLSAWGPSSAGGHFTVLQKLEGSARWPQTGVIDLREGTALLEDPSLMGALRGHCSAAGDEACVLSINLDEQMPPPPPPAYPFFCSDCLLPWKTGLRWRLRGCPCRLLGVPKTRKGPHIVPAPRQPLNKSTLDSPRLRSYRRITAKHGRKQVLISWLLQIV